LSSPASALVRVTEEDYLRQTVFSVVDLVHPLVSLLKRDDLADHAVNIHLAPGDQIQTLRVLTCGGARTEEADLMGGSEAQVSIVNTGVAVTQIIDPHPVNVNTFASEIVLPSFERMDECGLLKVK